MKLSETHVPFNYALQINSLLSLCRSRKRDFKSEHPPILSRFLRADMPHELVERVT